MKENPEMSALLRESSALLSLRAAGDLTVAPGLRRVVSLGADRCGFPVSFPVACLVPVVLIGEDNTLLSGPMWLIITKDHASTSGNVKPCEQQSQKAILGSKSAHTGIHATFQLSGVGAGFGH